ncbi:MAG: hypothetical protein K0S41_1869, partial [Anaerocolumna sp.]|nr:hypothetical protein [Anaerocolumna sp.]
MRKFWYIILLLINISLLSSCSSVGAITERLNLGSEEKQADARMQQLIEAIQEQDKDGLKSLFSQKALIEAEDID